MNFVTNVFKKYIKNESTQQDNERTGKLLVAEPSGQKPRRSVLKEFDPFAPESPCPVTQKIKQKIEEEELFEDAETSLTSFICKNSETKKSKSPKNATSSNREILLIPDLMEYCPEVKSNDTADLSYKEALESLSLSTELQDDSSEDVEFKPKATENRSVVFVESNFQNGVLLNSTRDLNDSKKINDTDIKQNCTKNGINTFNHNLNSSLHDVTFELYSNQSENPAQENNANILENNSTLQQFKNPLEQSNSFNTVSLVEETQILNNCSKISENLNQTFEKDAVLKTDKNTGDNNTNDICNKTIDLVQNETSSEPSNEVNETLSVENLDSNKSYLANNVDNSFIKEGLNKVNQQTMDPYPDPSTEKPLFANTNTKCEAESVALEVVNPQIVESCSKLEIKDNNFVKNQKKYITADSVCPDKTIASYKDEIVKSPSQSSLHDDDKKETEDFENIIPQSNCSISQNVENQPVSLQDILNVEPSLIKNSLTSSQKKANSFANISNENNISLTITAEDPADPAKLLEALAQSFNHTIDIEESAIVDDVNSSTSPNTSSELENEDLNVTVDLPTKYTESVKSEQWAEESLEKSKDIKRQSLSGDKILLDNDESGKLSKELVIKMEPNSIVSQTNLEFDDFELKCKANVIKKAKQHIKDKNNDSKGESFKDSSNDISHTKTQNIKESETLQFSTEILAQEVEPNSYGVYQRQDTQEFEDLEQKCETNFSEQNPSINASYIKEPFSNTEMDVTRSSIEIDVQVEKGFSNNTSYVKTPFTSKETSEEIVAQEMEPNSNKLYQRQDTQEFEDFEQQCKMSFSEQDPSVNTGYVKTNFSNLELDVTKSSKVIVDQEEQGSSNNTSYRKAAFNSKETSMVAQEVEPNYNEVYQRQDTQEFEDLEQGCKKNLSKQQDSLENTSVVKTSSSGEIIDATKSCEEVILHEVGQDSLNITMNIDTPLNSKEADATKSNNERVAEEVELNPNKVYQRQDTRAFKDIEQGCKIFFSEQDSVRYNTQECNTPEQKFNAVVSEPTKVFCGSQLSKETVQNLKTEEQLKTHNKIGEPIYGEVEIENFDLNKKQCADHVKIRVSGNFCHAVSKNCNPTKAEETVSGTIKSSSENDDPCTTKTNLNSDFGQAMEQTSNHNNTASIINDNCDLVTEETDETKKRTEVLITNENEQATNVNNKLNRVSIKPECRPSTRTMRNQTQVIETKYVDEQLKEYQTKNNKLKNEMDTLKTEIDILKKDNMKKDKLILTCALDIEVERCTIVHFKKVVEEYEQEIKNQCEKLFKLREESEKNAKQFTAFEMAFADVFEKYQKAKGTIEQYKKNEEILQNNLQNADDQMTKLQAKCAFMKDQYEKQIRKAEEQLAFEKEKYKQELSKLETIVKRLEIKSSSLETSLKQKTEECRALAALCDDITGNTM